MRRITAKGKVRGNTHTTAFRTGAVVVDPLADKFQQARQTPGCYHVGTVAAIGVLFDTAE